MEEVKTIYRNLKEGEVLNVESALGTNSQLLYNIKLTKEKPWKRYLKLSASIFGGVMVGAFVIYSY